MASRNTTQGATNYSHLFEVSKYTPLIVSSLTEANVYYLFRRQGVEIRFEVDGKKLYCATHTLSPSEIFFINKTIIGDK